MQTLSKATPQTSSSLAHSTDRDFSRLFTPLTEKGLDRLTDSRIEHIICTTALAAFY